MDRKSILKRFEDELRESHENYLQGNYIPFEKFKWDKHLVVREPRAKYRQDETWTPVGLDPRFEFQIDSIEDYLVGELVNMSVAYKFKQKIEYKIEIITDYPETGTKISSLVDDISTGFELTRRLTVNNYLIIYNYYKEDNFALITHVFHQMQNYGKIFQE